MKALNRFSISSMMAWFLRTDRYWAKSTVVGCSLSCWTLRRTSSLRFLKAWREATVWPRRPRELVTLVQSSLRAALRCRRGRKLAHGFRGRADACRGAGAGIDGIYHQSHAPIDELNLQSPF